MAKKTSEDKKFDEMEQFNSEICKLKHVAIDREFKDIKTDADRRHTEIVGMIQGLQSSIKEDVKDSQENLKSKIVLTEKTIGEKIDCLSDFDDSLKGNGNPGVWESIRSLTWKFRISITLILMILLIVLGGNFRGLTFEKIRQVIWPTTNILIVEDEGTRIHIGEVRTDEDGYVIFEDKNNNPFFVFPDSNQ